MITIIKAGDRYFSDLGWLKTYWLFSFSDYYDASNIQHGTLRVFNDDIVAPHRGFGTHPHEEMEIISIVLEGEMVHKDTMGNEMVIRPGDVQRMTAGTGLQHSERNPGDVPVHFFQIWITPDKKGLRPSYDQRSFEPSIWRNTLALLASDKHEENIVSLNSGGSIYRGALDAQHPVSYPTEMDRKIFLYVIDGSITINGLTVEQADQARIGGEENLEIRAPITGDFILIDAPASP